MTTPMKSTITRVVVRKVVEGRYIPGTRPVLWDERRSGFDHIETLDGTKLCLASNGGQSTPAPGWELMLISYSNSESAPDAAFEWTLFGISPHVHSA